MLICILSDSHDNIPLLVAAVRQARDLGAQAILHCGDLVAASTLDQLNGIDIPIHLIHGNNAGDLFTLSRMAAQTGNALHYYGQDAALTLADKRVFLVHYPHYARALALTGEWDVVCCGHSHRSRIDSIDNIKGGHTWLINPGTVGGVGGAPATFIMSDLSVMTFELVTVQV